MAPSPAHKLGQIIGDAFELAIRDQLAEVAAEFGLYLDYKRPREARGNKRKVAWRDIFGNSHDLDYVLEQGGKEDERGTPRAFIEIAWRRYTKHARNKVQEIQGAVLPLAETFPLCPPFKGAVLAGNFTASACEQLHAHGFEVAYCRYEVVISAFRAVGVDVASDEQTTEKELRRKIKAYEHLSNVDRHRLVEEIRRACASEVEPFIEKPTDKSETSSGTSDGDAPHRQLQSFRDHQRCRAVHCPLRRVGVRCWASTLRAECALLQRRRDSLLVSGEDQSHRFSAGSRVSVTLETDRSAWHHVLVPLIPATRGPTSGCES